jgi:hypothetical protein
MIVTLRPGPPCDEMIYDYAEGVAHRGHIDGRSASMDLGREAADRCRELCQAWGDFGDGAAAWAVRRAAVHLASTCSGGLAW